MTENKELLILRAINFAARKHRDQQWCCFNGSNYALDRARPDDIGTELFACSLADNVASRGKTEDRWVVGASSRVAVGIVETTANRT